MIQGSAGPSGSASSAVPTCATPLGTAALIEPQDRVLTLLKGIGLDSPVPLIRLMMQQSNCFQVVDRGAAVGALSEEEKLRASGMLVQNSTTARGHLVAAQFLITPNVVFDNPNAGGASGGGLLGALAGGPIGLIAGAAASLRVKEAQTVLFVTDAESGIQMAAAAGSAKVTDFGGLGGLGGFGGGIAGLAGMSGYGNTDEGKLIAASLLDSYRKLVAQLQAARPKGPSVAASPQSPAATQAGTTRPNAVKTESRDTRGVAASTASGSKYTPAVTVNVRQGPGTDTQIIAHATPGTVLTATGERKGDWWLVAGPDFRGWVLSTNLKPAGP